jgi:His/Glu/Gln/Arg/opine family amino acid ABC transporter permease subunit
VVTPVEERPASAAQAKPPFWRDITIVKWVAQVGVLVAVVWLLWTLISEAIGNLDIRGIPFSWDFLGNPVGITLGEGFNTLPGSAIEALAVGMVNMLRITFSGVIAATIFGTIIGVARLSKNWIVNKTANAFIEFFRNIPLLVQIFFWQALVLSLGELTVEEEGTASFFASSKGVAIPWFNGQDGQLQYVALLLIGAYVARRVYKWRVAILEREGRETNAMTWALLTFLGFLVIGWFAHPIMGVFGWVFSALAWLFGNVDPLVYQLVLAALSLFLGWRYIKGYLDERRTPAGLAKLTDDDYFKLILGGFIGVALAVFFISGAGNAFVEKVLGRSLTYGMNWGLEPTFSWLATRFDFLTGAPLDFNLPQVVVPTRFPQYSNVVGKSFTPAYLAVWVGVVLYTSAFIGEIVRAGIMAVPKGQNEAASAVGLSRGRVLRLVVLPQAFRIILPPLGSQYLNLAKNTSLGIAVAYADIVQVGQTIFNQTGQSLAVFIIWMGFYSIVSLVLSGIVNYYNRKMKLVER